MIVGVGIDVVDIARFTSAEQASGSLSGRLLTHNERALPPHSRAARFAAKEALAKALGAPAGLSWQDAEVMTHDSGAPYFVVTGTVADRAKTLGVTQFHLSMSHDGGVATAIVIAEG